ncbi:MAG: hypothetical protein QM706_14150 [Nitrospira sp.]
MSYLSYRLSNGKRKLESRLSGLADETAAVPQLSNTFSGVVISKQDGLTRTTARVRLSERTDLRIRWPTSSSRHADLGVGSHVRLSIPESAVQLEAGGFRRGKQRWNRWIGRIVLVQQRHDGTTATTVKIHRDRLTLKSWCPVIGAQSPLTTWDTVNIVIDPERISLTSADRQLASLPMPETHVPRTAPADLAWVSAFVRDCRHTGDGVRSTLCIGDVDVFVVIDDGRAELAIWKPGITVEFSIDNHGSWIRHNSAASPMPCCLSLSSTVETTRPSLSRAS